MWVIIMRKPFIAGNWKMNKKIGEGVSLVKELKEFVMDANDKDILVCPSFIALSSVSAELKGSNIMVGAQNMHFEDEGAFTGEICPDMLKEVGVNYVIIGHSERRHIFNEDDELINKKVKRSIVEEMNPILCVGETLEQREADDTQSIIEMQISKNLAGVTEEEMKQVTIAYEPVWAIGTGKTATPEQAQEVHKFIRELIKSMLGVEVANNTRILYGGSVKPDNVKGLMAMEDIDGGLVGGASLDAKSFADIVNY